MKITIRAEKITDYARIAEINALAFAAYIREPQSKSFVSEFAMVDGLRHSPDFDPELSLVAEVAGEVVGHALFYPFAMLVGGQELPAVSLGPIAVAPTHQKTGVGGALIDHGHRIAREKGHTFAFLLGHPSYYPRFGYQTNMFGACSLKMKRADIPAGETQLEERLVGLEDIEFLRAMWRDWFHDVDLSIVPGASILDWITHVEHIISTIVAQDGERIGYLRYSKHDPTAVKMFLARDKAATQLLLQYLHAKAGDGESDTLNLPLHPNAHAVREYIDLPYASELTTWDAGMIHILDEENETIQAYCAGVRRGERPPGCVLYPPSIEVAE
ncbi:MAG: N-acetyltransferase [Anaerolineales bacterium]|nr:N-acetyltransferase [Anaerolineales bacterium]